MMWENLGFTLSASAVSGGRGGTTAGLQLVAIIVKIMLNPRIDWHFHDFTALFSKPFLCSITMELEVVMIHHHFNSFAKIRV